LSRVHVRWLKLARALAAFLPLAVISTPFLAIRIGPVFIACLVYLWPVTMVANRLDLLDGDPPFGLWHIALAALYCAAIGGLFAWMLAKAFRLADYVNGGAHSSCSHSSGFRSDCSSPIKSSNTREAHRLLHITQVEGRQS
jgi:hypothetical protein